MNRRGGPTVDIGSDTPGLQQELRRWEGVFAGTFRSPIPGRLRYPVAWPGSSSDDARLRGLGRMDPTSAPCQFCFSFGLLLEHGVLVCGECGQQQQVCEPRRGLGRARRRLAAGWGHTSRRSHVATAQTRCAAAAANLLHGGAASHRAHRRAARQQRQRARRPPRTPAQRAALAPPCRRHAPAARAHPRPAARPPPAAGPRRALWRRARTTALGCRAACARCG
jgi:hypothetical protein